GSIYYPFPLKISKRGYFIYEDGKERLVEIPPDSGNLICARYLNEKLIMISSSDIFIDDPKNSFLKREHYEDIKFNQLIRGENLIYILTDKGVGTFDGQDVVLPDVSGKYNIKSAYESDNFLYAASDMNIYIFSLPLSVNAEPELIIELANENSIGTISGITGDVLLPEPCKIIAAGSQGLLCLNFDVDKKTFEIKRPEIFAQNRVPLSEPKYITKMWDGGFVVATSGGAYRITNRDGFLEWRVYNRERWVASEDVRHILTNPEKELSTLYFATAKGLSYVEFRRETIEDKLRLFVERIVKRHDRDGAVADSRLMKRGDLSTNIPWDSDNDGSWTSYWLLAECFRYK
ncbi:MAG: hypothetical protein N3B13_12525, partial [Deltaproteobacteria bacterium]|nr:hypothetical protein [Deltaproteobacteria bacterium]